MIPEILRELDKLSLSDMIRIQKYINEKCEKIRKENPNSFASTKWAVYNPEKAKERNRIQSQLHRDKIKEKEKENNIKI